MKNAIISRVCAIILALCTVICAMPLCLTLAEESEPIVLIAGSDFQAASTEEGVQNVKSIISAIKNDGYGYIDGFLFGGDYNTDYNDMNDEILALKNAVKSEYSGIADENMIFVQGNHDPASSVGLSKSGANDSEHYGVFVINEDDYMWYNNDEQKVKATAEALESYLKQKSESGYEKPVFVVSHLSLNYSKRTYNDGDGMYAKYLFDVLNSYGEALNILFLHGHNHNNRYDDYIGGSTVFLAKGDTIFIGKPGDKTATPDARTLTFTYLNYGYVSSAYCLNNAISMTLFEIRDNVVSIKRYGTGGRIALKTKGEWASALSETADFYGTDDSYLDLAYDGPEYASLSGFVNNVTVVSPQVSKISVTEKLRARFPGYQTAYAGYDIDYNGIENASGTVKIKLSNAFDESKPVFVRDTVADTVTAVFPKNRSVTFYAENLSSYELYQTTSAALDTQTKEIYLPASQFVDGENMIIVSKNAAGEAFALKNAEGTAISAEAIEIKNGNDGLYIETDDNSIKWRFIHDQDFGYAAAIGDLENLATGRYLVAADGNTLSTVDDTEVEYTAWRNAASTSYGMYTLPNKSTYDRSYVKYDNGFTVSSTEDAVRRVYLFVGTETQVEYAAYSDNLLGAAAVGADGNDSLGSKIYLASTDGELTAVDATLSMLTDANGNPVSADKAGVYSNLSLVYNGVTVCSGYTLFVGTDPVYPDIPQGMLGDVNNNGEIEKYDYILVRRAVMNTIELTDAQILAADVNKGGDVEKFDYILIKRHVMKTYTIEG